LKNSLLKIFKIEKQKQKTKKEQRKENTENQKTHPKTRKPILKRCTPLL
jgi:hypothetical protein